MGDQPYPLLPGTNKSKPQVWVFCRGGPWPLPFCDESVGVVEKMNAARGAPRGVRPAGKTRGQLGAFPGLDPGG